MRHLAENIQALACTRVYPFGQQPCAPVRHVQAVTGIALGIEHVGVLLEAPDLGKTVGGNADLAAPLEFDSRVGQLREHLEHFRAHVRGDVLGVAPRVVAGTTEQQAPVGGQPVVIQADFLVAQRQVLWDQLLGHGLRQRLGGDDVAARRQYLAAQARLQLFKMGIACQHQVGCAHAAACAAHLHRLAMDQLQHRAVLKDAHPKGLGRLRFTQYQVERVQMPGTHVDQAAGIHSRAHHLCHVLWADQPRFMGIPHGRQVRLFALERRELRRSIGEFAKAPAQVTVDAVLGNALAHQGDRVDTGPLHIAHALLAHVFGKPGDIMANATDQLPTVAPACAPTDAARFQQHHREPALGQFDGGVDPGKAAADHTHIGAQVCLKCGPLRHGIRRSAVIGRGVFIGLHHRLDFTLLQARVITRMVAGVGVVEI